MQKANVQKIVKSLLLVSLGILVGYYIGTNKVTLEWKNYRPSFTIQSKTPPKGIDVDLTLFWDVWERLTKNYVDKSTFDTKKMLYGAISGLVASLEDPYTVFLPPDQNSQIKQELAGQFEGIGAQLGVKDKKIVVIAPLTSSPAEKAGIKAGDFVWKVDDKDTSGWTLPQAVSKIRGPKGTTVKLTIVRENLDKPLDIQIVRETIKVKSVEGKLQKWREEDGQWKVDEDCVDCPSVAYIKLSQFGDETDSEWLIAASEVSKLIKENPKNNKGVILDLRNNSGGYLNGAVFIASEFIKEGTVVVQERGDGTRQNFPVNRKGSLVGEKIIVLINKGSASASEIVAGALRDYNRARLIGEKSFGKGTIQEAQEVGGGAGLHITVAKWLTPKGHWVNGKGLEPDIAVDEGEDETQDEQLERAVEELVE